MTVSADTVVSANTVVFLLLPHSLNKVFRLPTHELLPQLSMNLLIADLGENISKHVFS